MLVSRHPRRVGLVASSLLFSILLTATSLPAKDGKQTKSDAYYKEVWAKLETLVAAGKLSKEDASKKMHAIKKVAYGKRGFPKDVFNKDDLKKRSYKKDAYKKSDDTAASLHLESVWLGLRGLVAAGKMSRQEAESIIVAIKKRVDRPNGVQKAKGADAEVAKYFEEVWAELRAAVAAGKLTEEQAIEKMIAIKKAKLGS